MFSDTGFRDWEVSRASYLYPLIGWWWWSKRFRFVNFKEPGVPSRPKFLYWPGLPKCQENLNKYCKLCNGLSNSQKAKEHMFDRYVCLHCLEKEHGQGHQIQWCPWVWLWDCVDIGFGYSVAYFMCPLWD